MMQKNSQNPVVTVIITTYNRSTMVSRAIQSVLNQTYSDFELIVVDDCSTDNTQEVVEAFHDRRLYYIRYNKNRGLAAARNTGIQKARGKYVAFLDDDDVWLPNRLAVQIEAAEKSSSEYGAFYCGYLSYRYGDKPVKIIPHQRGDLMAALLKGWTPPSSCSFFRKDALERIGGIDENIKSGVDHEMWMNLAAAGYKFDFVPEALVIPNQDNSKERMTITSKRIVGIEGFLAKWREEIVKHIGEKGFNRFRRHYLAREYYKFGLNAIQNRRYFLAIRNLVRALFFYPTYKLAWAVLLIYTFTGSKGFNFFKRIYLKIVSRNDVRKQTTGIPGL